MHFEFQWQYTPFVIFGLPRYAFATSKVPLLPILDGAVAGATQPIFRQPRASGHEGLCGCLALSNPDALQVSQARERAGKAVSLSVSYKAGLPLSISSYFLSLDSFAAYSVIFTLLSHDIFSTLFHLPVPHKIHSTPSTISSFRDLYILSPAKPLKTHFVHLVQAIFLAQWCVSKPKDTYESHRKEK